VLFADEWYKRLREEGAGPVPVLDGNKASKIRCRTTPTVVQVTVLKDEQQQFNTIMSQYVQGVNKSLVITSSPSEDHTYSAGPTGSSPTSNGTRLALSPDEAFGEGSASSTER
jgi:hypothetical protein